ncbi:MAG: DUF4476 domain-containing protein [Phycisphaerales bacterium]|nr:DUF4476 domain-containing protein [Phycisphaerales bacterium]
MSQYKNILLFILLTLSLNHSFKVEAQDFSYVYIQGDKKIPIYTKLEGVMMPRYGKNYALISRLAPGPVSIEILFQQNEFPPLQFSILVPENGKRAFVLQKKVEGFSLYDVEQNFYLKPNNDIAEDHLPTVLNNMNIKTIKFIENTKKPSVAPIKAVTKESDIKAITKNETIKAGTVIELPKGKAKPVVQAEIDKIDTTVVGIAGTDKPTFIQNIFFENNALRDTTKESIVKKDVPAKDTANEISTPKIINSDCKGEISVLNFLKMNNHISAKKTEDEKLGLILEAANQYCFSTEQCQKMVEKLDTDIARFTAIKKLYPKTTNQSNFRSLESLLSEEEWKDYFRSLLNKE